MRTYNIKIEISPFEFEVVPVKAMGVKIIRAAKKKLYGCTVHMSLTVSNVGSTLCVLYLVH
jgi:hypothetical protein